MEQIFGQLLGDLLQGVLSIILYGTLAFFTGQVIQFVKVRYIDRIKDENLKKVINDSLERLEDLVAKGVKATEVSVGSYLREMVKDSKIDRSELLGLKDVVRDEVLAGLSDDFKSNVELGVGDINTYINQLIEIKLDEIKKELIITE